MSVVGWLRRLWPCAHRHTYWEKHAGVWYLLCHRCAYRVPAFGKDRA